MQSCEPNSMHFIVTIKLLSFPVVLEAQVPNTVNEGKNSVAVLFLVHSA